MSSALDPSLAERLGDKWAKLRQAATVVWGALPGGSFRFGGEEVRGVPQRVFKAEVAPPPPPSPSSLCVLQTMAP